MLNKKNTFEDYISAAKFLIEKKYTEEAIKSLHSAYNLDITK